METIYFIILGMLCPSSSLGQVLEDIGDKRYTRSVVNMDELLVLADYHAGNLENFAAELQRKAIIIRWAIYQMANKQELLERSLHQNKWDNSLEIYSLVRHMQEDWLRWQLFMEKPVGEENVKYINTLKPNMPKSWDFHDAAEGLRRMQTVYAMSIGDMAQGALNGVKYNSSLSARDCMSMAKHLTNQSRWEQAENWIEAGIKTLKKPEPYPETRWLMGPNETDFYVALAQVQEKLGDFEDGLNAYQNALKNSPHNSSIFQNYQLLENKQQTFDGFDPFGEEQDAEEFFSDDSAVPHCCSGKCKKPKELDLYCFYDTKTSRFLQLGAIKKEILSLDPYVALFHDMVNPKERSLLRQLSKQHLKASTTLNLQSGAMEVESFRTSKSVWFPSEFNEVTQRLTIVLEQATGLNIEWAEMFQIINYGLGGLFEAHVDSLLSDEDRFMGKSDRIATTIFYLSEVSQGGATLFKKLNLTVFPQPGAALFWYNLKNNGNAEPRSIHVGCPVIVGSKWVMSKWIFDQGQEFRRPCSKLSVNKQKVYK
ncbi:hypothetical protein KR018_008820 [Drosophila ironensis]|nr:hypothetical protein KR018_008820 [Drosophila ironensis]